MIEATRQQAKKILQSRCDQEKLKVALEVVREKTMLEK